MFACLYSLTVPVAARVLIAEQFTPRFAVMAPLVMLDISDFSKRFDSPREIGAALRRAATGPVRIALAPTQTAAALLAMSRPGLSVITAEDTTMALAGLPVSLLGDLDRVRFAGGEGRGGGSISLSRTLVPARGAATIVPRTEAHLDADDAGRPDDATVASTPSSAFSPAPLQVGTRIDALAHFSAALDRVPDAASSHHDVSGQHPQDTYATSSTRRPRCTPVTPLLEHSCAVPASDRGVAFEAARRVPARPAMQTAWREIDTLLETLRRWGIKTFAALAALPPGDVYERLGARAVVWQRVARGVDTGPLLPWVPEEPFEGAIDLEWPIEGLEPLSFVLGRLLEPIAARLEGADRGAVVVHTHLRLVSKAVHARTLQVPAPTRDPKVLRTLVLLDLESNPPAAAIDRVQVLIEPTPPRITEATVFERAQPSPEQISTLVARLSALMGESHVGSPALADSSKPGAFEMHRFAVRPSGPVDERRRSSGLEQVGPRAAHAGLASALRRFRLPVAARVTVHEGRPVRVLTDRRGVTGGAVVQSTGPWRTSGEWLRAAASTTTRPPHAPVVPAAAWDRDEWDVTLADGIVYRLSVARDVGHWFIEGTID